MRRFFLVFTLLSAILCATTHAQRMREGSVLLNAGPGFIRGIGMSASADYGLIDDLGPGIFTAGGMLSLRSYSNSEYINGKLNEYTINGVALNPRATYRIPVEEDFEVFGAFMPGIFLANRNKTSIFVGLSMGVRYSISTNISVFGEIGFSIPEHILPVFLAGISVSL